MKVLVALSIFCVLQDSLIQAVDSKHVDYTKQDEWSGTCKTGYEQSPINIDTNYVIQDKNLPEIKYDGPNKPITATATNIGYIVQFNFSGGVSTMAGTGLKGRYILSNLYFHWPSEHTVNGRHIPLEGHWVHYNERYSNLEEAYEHEDGAVYIVSFYDIGAEENIAAIDQFADAIASVAKRVGSQAVIERLNLDVPARSNSFYKYRGSKTVPPCTEDVTYILIEQPLLITQEEYQKITTLYNQDGKRVKSNDRHTQPLNGRQVNYRLQSSEAD